MVLLRSRNQRPRGHKCVAAHPDSINARSPERATDTCAFCLTLTYIDVANPEVIPILGLFPSWRLFARNDSDTGLKGPQNCTLRVMRFEK